MTPQELLQTPPINDNHHEITFYYDVFEANGIKVTVTNPSSYIQIDTNGQAYYSDPQVKIGRIDFNPFQEDQPIARPLEAIDMLKKASQGLYTLLDAVKNNSISKPDLLVGITNTSTAILARKLGFESHNEPLDDYVRNNCIWNLNDIQIHEFVREELFENGLIEKFLLLLHKSKKPNQEVKVNNIFFELFKRNRKDPVRDVLFTHQLLSRNGFEILKAAYTGITKEQFDSAMDDFEKIFGIDFLIYHGRVLSCEWSVFHDRFTSLTNSKVATRIMQSS